MSADDGLFDALEKYVGQACGPARTALDVVNGAAIRRWCDALGDTNLAYQDEERALTLGLAGICAPPSMLQSWTLHDRRQPPDPIDDEHIEARLMAELADMGYAGVVATNCEQIYHRPTKPGDRLQSQAKITAISGPKMTGLGEGYFVTTQTMYIDQDFNVVGEMLFRVLRHRTPEGEKQSTRRAPSRPVISSNPLAVVGRSVGLPNPTTKCHIDVKEGDTLVSLDVPITPTLIIGGAMASSDFNVLHHDRDRAVASGSPDIFMNILTTNGLVDRFIGEWAGPGAVFRRIAIRLGAPNYPYDKMRLDGEVTRVDDDAKTVEVTIRGVNSFGDHVSGAVVISLP